MEASLSAMRARYASVRWATARCLYVAHKLAGQAARQDAIAEAARSAGRRALAERDVLRSRASIGRAGDALERARRARDLHEAIRARADAGLDGLRRIGDAIEALELERLRALGAADAGALGTDLDEARRSLDLLEAERELDRELG